MSVRSVRDTEDISRGPNFFLIGLLDENGGNAEEIIFKEIIGICRIEENLESFKSIFEIPNRRNKYKPTPRKAVSK